MCEKCWSKKEPVYITAATLLCLQETWPLLKNRGNIKLEKHSLFPQQPSKDCNKSPSMPDTTIKTNRSVLISGMQTTRLLINIPAYFETWSKILFWSEKRMRGRDFQSEFRRGDPVWNAGKGNLSATVSQGERREKWWAFRATCLPWPLSLTWC